MRERLLEWRDNHPECGITPAYAGKTFILPMISATIAGSPPRMRERPHWRAFFFRFMGITPAYAGKTPIHLRNSKKNRDHPRVCGKDFSPCFELSLLLGSPPRMRERRFKNIGYKISNRITPAYAGKTLKNPNKIATSSKRNNQIYLLFKANSSL